MGQWSRLTAKEQKEPEEASECGVTVGFFEKKRMLWNSVLIKLPGCRRFSKVALISFMPGRALFDILT